MQAISYVIDKNSNKKKLLYETDESPIARAGDMLRLLVTFYIHSPCTSNHPRIPFPQKEIIIKGSLKNSCSSVLTSR